MGVTINSWMTGSSGWRTMNRMQAAAFSEAYFGGSVGTRAGPSSTGFTSATLPVAATRS
jgi:hypothetical protein